ncbi:hypothetical protein PSTT_05549 [Puccinia striiformis]|uniref:Uncharacterized protein n=1 Tax=Puccinia striiformis TaxID=27350 RepID=A0A2S4VNG3_9BASI|nr:hypothetical protein PSTT_05549 [Puccinia striiformis]
MTTYIPMDRDDPNYLREESREEAEGFEKCRCSNCAPEDTEMILKNIGIMSNDNFDAFLDRPSDYVDPNPVQPTKKEATRGGKKTNTSGPNPVLDQFVVTLVNKFNTFFKDQYGKATSHTSLSHQKLKIVLLVVLSYLTTDVLWNTMRKAKLCLLKD